MFFMEVKRSSSRSPYPASIRAAPLRMSRSRDGRGLHRRGQGAREPSETKLQHLAANLRWTACNGGDRLNHPRYRDFATIPAADFLQ
jgi:hypothetical protein